MLGKNTDIDINKQHTMGAGDSVATVLSLSHIWDLEEMMKRHAKKEHARDPRFFETAAMVFVSLMSRVAGDILYHSSRCDWSSIPPPVFRELVGKTAEKSLDKAMDLWKGLPSPQSTKDPEWDICIAAWRL